MARAPFSRTAFLKSLWPLAIVAVVFELGLYFVMGARWFGFYGHAVTVLALVVPVAWLVTSRFTAQGFSRWPAWLFFSLVALAAILQIAYWTAFFSMSDLAAPLAMARGMAREALGPFELWALLAAALLAACLILRAAANGRPSGPRN